jgi:predicted ATPase
MQRRTSLSNKGKPLLVLEQPELHLHPALQAKVADMLVRTATEPVPRACNVVAETHSETIINRLGAHIRKGTLDPKKVSIYVFERLGETTQVKEAQFDNEGGLNGWPFGFFLPDDLDSNTTSG